MIAGGRGQPRVVGVGASAGGLDAMLPLFARMPATGRFAFVVAQHMGRSDHGELLARLVQRSSILPVAVAGERTVLAPDTVTLIPAGRDGRISGGALVLSAAAPDQLSTPSVNALFASIAASEGREAIGILLSGAGSDGTTGGRAIRGAGGLVLAQDPAEARFPGMPSAALEAGVASRALTLEGIVEALLLLHPASAASAPGRAPAPVGPVASPAAHVEETAEQRELRHVVRQIRDATEVDFSGYKDETLLRRLATRKAAVGAGSAEEYQRVIRRDPQEIHRLQDHFLVSVSSFFRDRECFAALERALDRTLAGKRSGEVVRAWVPACASGEECYTLAAILAGRDGAGKPAHPIDITGSDLNAGALEVARRGRYPAKALADMDPALRERCFRPDGEGFVVAPALRAGVRFERRDVIAGAPARGLDLVTCRNLLIYLKAPLQDRLVGIFAGALRPGGLLLLAPSESLGTGGEALFEPVDLYQRLFRRRDSAGGGFRMQGMKD